MEPTLTHIFRSRRLQAALGVLFTAAGAIVLLLRDDIDFLFNRGESPSRTGLLVGLALLGYGAAFLMLLYLRGGFVARSEELKEELFTASIGTAAVSELHNRVNSLSDEIAVLKAAQLDALGGSRQELVDALKPTVHAGIADELENRLRHQLSQSERDKEIRELFASAQHRLRAELAALGRRSNLNLVIGVLTTSMAIGLLTYMVQGIATSFDGIASLLSHYIPRLGLVLFIEVFSFFFLRLYKTTLAEMRMYQSDLTALAIQQVAVVAGLSTGDSTGAVAVSKELLALNPPKHEGLSEQNSDVDPKALSELVQVIAKLLPAKAKDA